MESRQLLREDEKMKIPPSKPFIDEKDIAEVSKVVSSGMHASGNKTVSFEKEMARLHKMSNAKAVNCGTNAIFLSLRAIGIDEGDEVILPSYVCYSVLAAVENAKAKPVLVDIQDNFIKMGYNISLEKIKQKISPKTKAVIVPHMFGYPAKIEEIKEFCSEKNIFLIEDCAMALGGELNKKPLGSFGDLSTFSFYATKMISSGQGGMVLTNSSKLKSKIDDLTQYDDRNSKGEAYNLSFTDIQAALGLSQLKKLKSFIKRRKQISKEYDKFLTKKFSVLCGGSYYRYIIKTKNEDELIQIQNYLKENSIISNRPVYRPLHRYLNLDPKDFPNTEEAFKTTLFIPLYPSLTRKEIDYVLDVLKEYTG